MESAEKHLVVITGFGEKGIPELTDELTTEVGFTHTHKFRSASGLHMFQHPDKIIERICRELEQLNLPPEQTVLLGHSYGGLIGLAIALKLRLSNFLKVILVDAPVNHKAEVPPVKGWGFLLGKQYKHRKKLAGENLAHLRSEKIDGQKNDAHRVISIMTQNDRIVADQAKRIEGFERIILTHEQTSPRHFPLRPGELFSRQVEDHTLSPDTGKNILLPNDQYRGHSLSPEKRKDIVSIVKVYTNHAQSTDTRNTAKTA